MHFSTSVCKWILDEDVQQFGLISAFTLAPYIRRTFFPRLRLRLRLFNPKGVSRSVKKFNTNRIFENDVLVDKLKEIIANNVCDNDAAVACVLFTLFVIMLVTRIKNV